ncbi:MAG TPA: hypothetical protein VN905_02860 [Candidatus Binatia bacterium]|nr:hypothetical protein [Candidatus Binatia bacterium]
MRPIFRVAAARIAFAAAVLCATISPATAQGVVKVLQNDGSNQVYNNVVIDYKKGIELRITTADKKGTLIIDNAACSYVGEIIRCTVSSLSLRQGGVMQRLDLERGTIYANLSSKRQQLPLTSQSLDPRGILLALRTKIGTYLTMTGAIDSQAS